MSDFHTDRNLLVGLLLLQMDFISREQLLQATKAWLDSRDRMIEDLLREQGAISEEDWILFAPLVQRHVANHQGDPAKSLAALSSITSVAEELRSVGDQQIDATISHVSADKTKQPDDATVAHESLIERLESQPPSFGNGERFRVLRPHAKGGLGQVYVAKDTELNREVALKEIQPQFADDERNRARFLVEAEITGGLEHPGIVPVYGLGKYSDGRPFYAMRFIKGDSLREAVDRFHANRQDQTVSPRVTFESVEFRKLLGRFIDVCDAVEYAHSRGVLHRDLKPGNIMLGKFGETLVVDWGLSKAIGRDDIDSPSDEPTLQPSSGSVVAPTVMGSAIGTPQYMSPEQAAGQLDQLGPVSDVYSLGATLYYLLAGQAPFGRKAFHEVLGDVQAGRFPTPGEVTAGVPKPLSAICLKAMSRDASNRYASPSLLAADVESWLADEPVGAYREPLSAKTWRWVRRHLTRAATVVLVGILFLTIGAILALNGYRFERAARSELAKNAQELEQLNSSLTDTQSELEDRNLELISERRLIDEQNEVLTAQKSELESTTEELVQNQEKLESTIANLNQTTAELQDANEGLKATTKELGVSNEELRARELQLAAANERLISLELRAQFGRFQSELTLATERIQVGDLTRALNRLDSIRTDEEYPLSFKSWELHRLYQLGHRELPSNHVGTTVNAVAVSGDGAVFAAAGETGVIHLYDGQSGEAIDSIELPDEFDRRVSALAFTADGGQLIVGTRGPGDSNLSVWDVATQTLLEKFRAHSHHVHACKLAADGLTLVTGGREGDEPYKQMRYWQREDLESDFQEVDGWISSLPVYQLDLSGDGNRVVMTHNSQRLFVWDRSTSELVAECRHDSLEDEDQTMIRSVVFDPRDQSGSRFFTGTFGGLVLDWDISEAIRSGGRAIVGSDDVPWMSGHTGDVRSIVAAIDPDRRTRTGEEAITLVSGGDEGSLVVWEMTTRSPRKRLSGHVDPISASCISSDGRTVYSGSRDEMAKIWRLSSIVDELNLQTSSESEFPRVTSPDVMAIDFNHDDSLVVAGEEYGRMTIWPAGQRDKVLSIDVGHARGAVVHASYSPDLDRIITATDYGRTICWDVTQGLIHWQDQYEPTGMGFDVSPDGGTLLRFAGRFGESSRLLRTDVESGESTISNLPTKLSYLKMLLSGDGRRVMLASRNFVEIWDLDTEERVWVHRQAAQVASMHRIPETDSVIVADDGQNTLRKIDWRSDDDDHRPTRFMTGLENVEVGDIRSVGDRKLLIAFSRKQNLNPDEEKPAANEVAIFDATRWDRINEPDQWVSPEALRRISIPGKVHSADLSPDGSKAWVVIGSGSIFEVDVASGEVREIDLSGQLVEKMPKSLQAQGLHINRVQIAESGEFVVSGFGHAWIWDPVAEVDRFRTLPKTICLSVCFHPTENRLVAVHGDGNLRVLELFTVDGEWRARMLQKRTGEFVLAEYSPDGSVIATIDKDGRVVLCDSDRTDETTELETGEDAGISVVRFSPDGSHLVAGSRAGQILMWRLEGEEWRPLELDFPDHAGPVSSLAVSRDGSMLLTGGVDGTAHLIVSHDDWDSLALLASPLLASDAISEVGFNAQGDRALIGSGRTIALWHVSSRDAELVQSVFQLPLDGQVKTAQFSRDGRVIVSAAKEQGAATVWLTDGWDLEKPSRADR